MIVFKRLSWDNCFSYGEGNSIDLNTDSIVQIIGENGSGKSSCALILEEVLYNKNSKGIKKGDIANRKKDGSYRISLDFDVDGDSYNITVKRKKTATVTLLKNGEDISSHTTVNTFKTIEKLIGIDHKTFAQLVYQNTNSSLQFLVATDTARKKFLIDLLRLEKYTEYFSIFKELSKTINNRVIELESKIETLQNWLSTNSMKDLTEKELLPEPTVSKEDEDKLVELKVKLSNLSATNRKITENENKKARLASLNIKDAIEEQGELQSTAELNSKLGALKNQFNSTKATLSSLKELEGFCPTCNQTISDDFKVRYTEQLTAEAEKIKAEYNKLKAELEKIVESNKLIQKNQKLVSEFETLYQSIDKDLPDTLLNESEIKEQISALSKKIEKQRRELREVTNKNLEIKKHNTKVKIFLEQAEKINKDISNYCDELEAELNRQSRVEVLKKAFSTNGLLAYKIESLVKELENITNQYLVKLSYGRFTIEFRVDKDKLNVILTDNGEEISITALSSGELTRVNTATLLAIRKLMNSISKTQINLLFLDEVINVLDEEGREKLVEVLSQETDLSTFVISHQWEHPLLSKLQIVKREEISEVLNEAV